MAKINSSKPKNRSKPKSDVQKLSKKTLGKANKGKLKDKKVEPKNAKVRGLVRREAKKAYPSPGFGDLPRVSAFIGNLTDSLNALF